MLSKIAALWLTHAVVTSVKAGSRLINCFLLHFGHSFVHSPLAEVLLIKQTGRREWGVSNKGRDRAPACRPTRKACQGNANRKPCLPPSLGLSDGPETYAVVSLDGRTAEIYARVNPKPLCHRHSARRPIPASSPKMSSAATTSCTGMGGEGGRMVFCHCK